MKLSTYRLPEKSKKKDLFFNMFGSCVNACVSIFLLVVVSHLLGSEEAGLFTLAYSSAQMLYTIASFEMRNVQVTDAKREFPFSAVLGYRLISVALMLCVSAAFILIRGYVGKTAVVISLFCVYMAILALSDSFQGNTHLNGYLFIAGRSIGITVMLCAIAFSVTLYFTRNLIVSIVPMLCTAFFWMLFHDVPYSNNFAKAKPSFEPKLMRKIFLAALPLFLSAFLNQYISNAPKYAIDTLLTATDQAHYGYLVMPAFAINLLSIFAFRPQLVTLSENWSRGEFSKFKKTTMRLYCWIGLVTVAALICGYFLGIPVLSLLYGADLSGKRGMLLMLLLAGCFSACAVLSMTLFTTMRKQKYCLAAYSITAIFALVVPKVLVSSYGIKGAAYAYLSEMMLLFACMLTMLVAVFVKTARSAGQYIKNTSEEGKIE